jgi:endonuclease/exonuclease/phosphatase (EEP) superfamily protein YafD
MRRMDAALHTLCWIVVVVAAGWLGLQTLGWHVGRWTTSAQALTPWVVPWAIVAAVTAAVLGRHGAALAGALVGTGFLALVAPLAFPARLPAADGSGTLTVLHANLLHSNPRIDQAIDAIVAVDADIVAVSELTPEFAAAIDASSIGSGHRHRIVRPGNAAVGLGIWSRVPIDAGEPIPGSTMTIAADVRLAGRTLHVVLAHPLPPLFHGTRWRSELDALRSMPGGRIDATLLVGDMNVSYYHPALRRFLADTDLRDVHVAEDRGFSSSWPTDSPVPPFVRLDHAFVGGRVTATAIDDVDIPGADHRAFVVTVAWAAS